MIFAVYEPPIPQTPAIITLQGLKSASKMPQTITVLNFSLSPSPCSENYHHLKGKHFLQHSEKCTLFLYYNQQTKQAFLLAKLTSTHKH